MTIDMQKFNTIFLATLGVTGLLFSSTTYADTSQASIQALKEIIQKQQVELNTQAALIQSEQNKLQAISVKLNKVLSSQGTHANNANTSNIGVSVKTNTPESVIQEASSPSAVVTIPHHQLVLGSKKSYVGISGQISAMGMQVDDGKFNRTYYGTNSNSNSRISFDSKMKGDDGITVGSRIQLGFDTNPSSSISQTTTSSSSIDIRRAEVYMSTKFGTFTLGKGETASDNTVNVDLSGTKILTKPDVQLIGGGMYFNGLSTNPQVSDVFNGLDGFSRKVRAQYDSPSIYGFELGTSAIEGNRADVALKYGHDFDGTKFAIEGAYTTPQDFNSSVLAHGNVADGSASILLPVGLNFSVAGAKLFAENTGRKDPYYYYFKPGYILHYFNAGTTAFALDYGRYYNFAQNNDTGIAKGVDIVQNLNALDLALYAGYKQFELKRTGSSFNNMNIFVLGALYQF